MGLKQCMAYLPWPVHAASLLGILLIGCFHLVGMRPTRSEATRQAPEASQVSPVDERRDDLARGLARQGTEQLRHDFALVHASLMDIRQSLTVLIQQALEHRVACEPLPLPPAQE